MIIDGSAYGTIDYTDELYNNNYENSLIREWLNSVFIETAFDTLQKEVIAVTTVDNTSKKVADYTNGSVYLNEANDTSDKVFLLSKSEAKNGCADKVDSKNNNALIYKYDCLTDADFSTATSRQKKVTDYAQAIGTYADDNNTGWWWLRTPSTEIPTNAQAGDSAHRINLAGETISNNVKQFGGVVPAMWITL